MVKIPYGISKLESLISEGYPYVDKTAYLRELEEAGKYLFLVRPGRSGGGGSSPCWTRQLF